MSADAPIGVFDSGVGGLTVVGELRRQLPNESILYLGDTARLPYGTKSQATVTEYTRRNLAFLRERNVKAMVVACNTASALALPHLVAEEPTWGVIEPGAVRAAATSRGRVGVIATEATVLSNAYGAALARLRPDLEVWSEACSLFVPLVEEGWQDDPVAELVAERYLAPLRGHGVDTVVLGCTHYPLLLPVLKRVLGEEVGWSIRAPRSLRSSPRASRLRACCARRRRLRSITSASLTPPAASVVWRRILGDAEVSLEHVDVR